MALLLGIDVGTTGARAILVDPEDGRVVAGATREYPLHTPKPLWAEQDANDWWRGVVGAVQDALSAAGTRDVSAVGLSGQMHGVVLLDAAGEPLGRSLIWCDGRSQEQCDQITSKVGAERLIELTSNPALVGFSAPKLLWVREHDPRQFERAKTFLLPKDFIRFRLTGERAKTFLLPKDFIRFRLTGERASEVSDASGTLLFDVGNRRWSAEMLDALGLDRALLPDVFESPVVTGRVRADVAAELGLPAGTPVVGGGGDQAAGAVGNGIVRAGLVSSTIGSSGVVFAHADAPVRDPRGSVHTFCHAVPGAWHVMGVTQGAGLSLRWFRDEVVGPLEREAAERAGRDAYEVMAESAAEAPAGCEGLVFLPYLMGERTPHLDPRARGVWFGLTAAHRRAHLTRSVMEGVAYSLRDCLDVLVAMGVPADEIRASGGGARSPLWRQIQADVFGRAVLTVNASEGPAYGAALLAGVGAGRWSTVPEACAATIAITTRLEPDAGRVATYVQGHAIYREIYGRLKDLFPKVS